MQKMSLQKKSFFNSIGLDTNRLPAELQIKSNSIQTKISREDLKFLNNLNLTIPKEKYFRLKNLYGTINLKLDNKTWIEIFSSSEKTDDIVKLYYKNPNYYFKDLKKLNQSDLKHNGSIELLEDNGQFFVKEGLARLSLVMIKYLLEMSRAQSKEEKLMINKQYTFSAVVRSVPKDKDIVYLVNMLFDVYGSKVKLQRLDADNECSYIMKLDNKKVEIKSKSDIENILKDNYVPKEFKDEDHFKSVLKNLAKTGLDCKENEDNVDQYLVMGKIFPNYEIFVKYYKKMIQYNLEDKLIEKLDLLDTSYDDILKKLIRLVKAQESKKEKEEVVVKPEKKSTKSVAKQVLSDEVLGNKPVTRSLPSSESKKAVKFIEIPSKKEIEIPSKREVAIQSKKEVAMPKGITIPVDEEKNNKVKEIAKSQISNIIDNIEMTYFKLKTKESNIIDLANSTTVELNIDKINDNAINSNISSIKQNSIILKSQIDQLNKTEDIKSTNELLASLKNLANDKSIELEYDEEMKSLYIVGFNNNAKRLITDSKLKKLDKQRKEVENEKCSFLSKLLGKAKLKQAKLDNINLKEQLILTESQFTSNSYYCLEDGLSDIYSYIKTEEDVACLAELHTYLKNLETNQRIKEMIDQSKLNRKTQEKINQQRNLPQLSLSKEKKRLFSKAQINLVEEKNNELKRVIQFNRANSLKLQNTGVIPILGNIQSTKAVKKFINNLTQIDSRMSMGTGQFDTDE